MGLLDLFRRRRTRGRVVITDDAITRTRPDGMEERVSWSDLVEVGILTTDEGPLQEDVFWLLLCSDRKSGCAIPQSSEGADRLLESFQKLPGFRHDVVIEAMGSTNNAKFTCWQRPVA